MRTTVFFRPQFRTTAEEVVWLRNHVETLEWELRMLKDLRATEVAALQQNMGITVSMARILAALQHGAVLNRSQLAFHCCHSLDADDRLVDSQVKRVRRRLPYLDIVTYYGAGYGLSEGSASRVRAIIRGDLSAIPDQFKVAA